MCSSDLFPFLHAQQDQGGQHPVLFRCILALFDLTHQFAQGDVISNLNALINFNLLKRRAYQAQRLQGSFVLVDHCRLDGGIDVFPDAHRAGYA